MKKYKVNKKLFWAIILADIFIAIVLFMMILSIGFLQTMGTVTGAFMIMFILKLIASLIYDGIEQYRKESKYL